MITYGLSQLLRMLLEKLLLTSFGAGLGPTLQDALGLFACREGWDLILHAGMNYFSLTSKAVLHASFLRVMATIFLPAANWGWGNIPAHSATTGGGKHLPGIPLPGVLLLLL